MIIDKNNPELGKLDQPEDKNNNRFNPGSTLSNAMKHWRDDFEKYMKSRTSPIAIESAKVSREKYHAKKMSEGKTVRGYRKHNHHPQLPGESHTQYQKRTHRDRQRTYRSPTVASGRGWTDLSMMSEDEKANHLKAQNRERQRLWRERAKKETSSYNNVSTKHDTLIEWGMF
ncbi:hypothetical protein D3C80_564560 [compost metagenome]